MPFTLLLGVQFTLGIVAVLVIGPGWRRIAVPALVTCVILVPFLAGPNPFHRVVLALFAGMLVIKTTQISIGTWKRGTRLWHLFMLFDVRKAQRVSRRFHWPRFVNFLIASLVAATAFAILSDLESHETLSIAVVRIGCGVALLYAIMEAGSHVMQFGHRLLGLEVPALQRKPILARSTAEFWSVRWNRTVSEWLGDVAFRPLARRRHPKSGLFAAFVASAVLHAWLAGVALGVAAGATMSAYFLLAGLVVLLEQVLRVRAWPVPASHAWTLVVLLAPSALVIDPFLRVLGL